MQKQIKRLYLNNYILPGLIIFLIIVVWSHTWLVSDGFLLRLDMVFTPLNYPRDQLSLNLPWEYFIHFLSLLIGGALVGKLLILSTQALILVSSYLLGKQLSKHKVGGYLALLLVLFNPFIYSRWLAGQWQFILGIGLLLLFFTLLFKHVNKIKYKLLALVLIWIAMPLVSAHSWWITAPILLIYLITNSKYLTKVERIFYLTLAFLTINFAIVYSQFESFQVNELIQFATLADARAGVWGTLLGWQGMWSDEIINNPVVLSGFVVVGWILSLIGLISGFILRKYRLILLGLILLITGILLASGASGPTAGLFLFLYNQLPLLNGFREPQKLLIIALIGQLIFTSLAIQGFYAIRIDNRIKDIIAGIIVGLFFISTAFAYLPQWQGQLKSTNYPDDIISAAQLITNDAKVLVLPWQSYISPSWTTIRIAEPAEKLFAGRVYSASNWELLEFGCDSINNPYLQTDCANSETIRWEKAIRDLQIDYLWIYLLPGMNGAQLESFTNLGEIVLSGESGILIKTRTQSLTEPIEPSYNPVIDQ